ncbi:electron transfer flavoprotein subunit alpha/FixB family protein [Caenimonas aquaedulcis]|uniref:Electron transfer flavoprotein subunit alpha/FixB family protein n=1 Tax=Caenimonas aquaedulcis TaxID=2793270 RepID=A0A931H0X3_9BURK|nr:electron transfer flavoprotein subunit alpha/FixB family protein [Caenimonas aquaedulcis]MBG9386429.1 electron transfer flavoprotein subunit alpha/FixB family protein [Caenimonas aquaedulcis]
MSVRITVVQHPWQTGQEERAALVHAAARLGEGAEPSLVTFTGEAHPAAIAARLAELVANTAGHQLVLFPTGTESEAIAALLAARTDGVSFGRCSGLSVEGNSVSATKTAFGGRAELALRSDARMTCATLRPPPEGAPAQADLRETKIELQAPPPYPVEPLPAAGGKPRVEGAAMVVSGGRGIGGPEGFEWLAKIADVLGAGLGGSLPAVDAGWVPVAHQVGISGKFVTPKVYFAVGISGTPQHLAGISPNTRVVALNKDRDAPIFARSDIGVEGDWHEILPLLAQALATTPPHS